MISITSIASCLVACSRSSSLVRACQWYEQRHSKGRLIVEVYQGNATKFITGVLSYISNITFLKEYFTWYSCCCLLLLNFLFKIFILAEALIWQRVSCLVRSCYITGSLYSSSDNWTHQLIKIFTSRIKFICSIHSRFCMLKLTSHCNQYSRVLRTSNYEFLTWHPLRGIFCAEWNFSSSFCTPPETRKILPRPKNIVQWKSGVERLRHSAKMYIFFPQKA